MGDIDIKSDYDSNDDVYSGSSYLSYVVVDLKLLDAILARTAHCHECGFKMLFEKI